ncbi:MAG: helix-turn-helix domain-containing protein [Ruminococcus sp.]|nr:helix-turn-helix domain-containing protein [Ruminococcus sp.]
MLPFTGEAHGKFFNGKILNGVDTQKINADELCSLSARYMANKISNAAGISSGTISDWRNGKSAPKLEAITKIADYLGCSVDYLLGHTENPSAHIKSNEVNNQLVAMPSQLTPAEQEMISLQIKGLLTAKKARRQKATSKTDCYLSSIEAMDSRMFWHHRTNPLQKFKKRGIIKK